MTRGKKITILALGIICAISLCIGSTLAYRSTYTGSKQNVFTFSDSVRARLIEPNWDADAARQLLPGQRLRKDPSIENIAKLPIYVAIRVTFQYNENNVMTQEDATRLNTLLGIEWDAAWFLVDGTYTQDAQGVVTAVSPQLIFVHEAPLFTGEISAPVFHALQLGDAQQGITEADWLWLQGLQYYNGTRTNDPQGLGGLVVRTEGAAVDASVFETAADAAPELIALF